MNPISQYSLTYQSLSIFRIGIWNFVDIHLFIFLILELLACIRCFLLRAAFSFVRWGSFVSICCHCSVSGFFFTFLKNLQSSLLGNFNYLINTKLRHIVMLTSLPLYAYMPDWLKLGWNVSYFNKYLPFAISNRKFSEVVMSPGFSLLACLCVWGFRVRPMISWIHEMSNLKLRACSLCLYVCVFVLVGWGGVEEALWVSAYDWDEQKRDTLVNVDGRHYASFIVFFLFSSPLFLWRMGKGFELDLSSSIAGMGHQELVFNCAPHECPLIILGCC